jgi:hypothetical protein
VWNNPLNATDPSGYVAQFFAAWAVNWAQGYLIGQIATALKIASFVNTAFAVYNTANSILSVAKAYTAWNDGAGGAVWGNLIGGFAKSWAMGVGNSCASGACDFGFDPFGVDRLGELSHSEVYSRDSKDVSGSKDKRSSRSNNGLPPRPRNLSEKEQVEFDSKLKDLRKNAKRENFKTHKEAAKWLHDNVHALAWEYDIEIGADIRRTLILSGEVVKIGRLYTQNYRNSVKISHSPDAVAEWHSHAKISSDFTHGADTKWAIDNNRHAYISTGHIGGGPKNQLRVFYQGNMSEICGDRCATK